MFDFLNFFSSGASIFSTGASLLNTYAQFRANKEKTHQAIGQNRYLLQQQEENAKFDRQQLLERTAKYGAISSYHIDMLRQEQMHNRAALGYQILRSGIGITSTDSAGLLLRHMAYMDEMKARSVEAEMFYKRPRSNFNPALADLTRKSLNQNISDIKSASPWSNAATLLGGVRDLASISRMGDGS